MSKKITIRIPTNLLEILQEESSRFGYKSVSSYIVRILEKRTVTAELAKAIFCLLNSQNASENGEREKEICQLSGSLMTGIAHLNR